MEKINLVLGANGHLGNNLVRLLLSNGQKVRASLRSPDQCKALERLECEVVFADLLDKLSLVKAMQNVEIVYDCAAVYQSWADDIPSKIIKVNIEGTRNVVDAAAIQKVNKLIYISTSHTLDLSRVPLDESTWNRDYGDPYRKSKTEAEKLALELANHHKLWMVSLLPCGMVGPNCGGHLTPTMEVLASILTNKLPFDPEFKLNLVDVRDVAAALITSAERGRNGERYLLGQREPVVMTDVFKLAHSLYPDVRVPGRWPFALTYFMAAIMELAGSLTHRQPLMQTSIVRTLSSDVRCNISKAQKELGFTPRPQMETIKYALEYLHNQYLPAHAG